MVASTGQSLLNMEWLPGCMSVVEDVVRERIAQVNRYGLQHGQLEHGTGPETRWLGPYTHESAEQIEQVLRDDYEEYEEETGQPTRLHLLREELAEVAKEPPGQTLYDELKQVAALAISHMEDLKAMGWVE